MSCCYTECYHNTFLDLVCHMDEVPLVELIFYARKLSHVYFLYNIVYVLIYILKDISFAISIFLGGLNLLSLFNFIALRVMIRNINNCSLLTSTVGTSLQVLIMAFISIYGGATLEYWTLVGGRIGAAIQFFFFYILYAFHGKMLVEARQREDAAKNTYGQPEHQHESGDDLEAQTTIAAFDVNEIIYAHTGYGRAVSFPSISPPHNSDRTAGGDGSDEESATAGSPTASAALSASPVVVIESFSGAAAAAIALEDVQCEDERTAEAEAAASAVGENDVSVVLEVLTI